MLVLTIAVVGALATVVGVGVVRRYALARNMVDAPNARGSHVVTTPRGGGLALVLAALAGTAALWGFAVIEAPLAGTLLIGGGLVAAIGFVDDHGHVAARWRLLAQVLAVGLAVFWLGPVVALELPAGSVPLAWLAVPLSLLAGVWLVNLYNFMDGIDGIAGVELVTVAGGMALVAAHAPGIFAPALLLMACGCGFLCWNWPPARIFMGDVGSGFLGFALGALMLAPDGVVLWSALILLGVFLVDATTTLLVRAFQGRDLSEAHRTHAYQHLAQRFGHGRVTVAVALINLLWLLPLALWAQRAPASGLLLTMLAWAPLLGAALWLGAGRDRVSA